MAIVCAGIGGTGSVANVAVNHADQLARRGWPVVLISDSFPDALPAGVEREQLRPPRFTALRRFAHLPDALAFSFSALALLRRLRRQAKLQAVIFHSHPDAALAGGWLQWSAQIPFVMVAHGVIFDRPPGTYDPLLSWLYRLTTAPAFRQAALVVALSPAMAELACRHGARRQALRLIPNGVDPCEIGLPQHHATAKAALLDPHGSLRLLFVGTLSPVKGVDVLVEACARLRRQAQSYELSLLGSGTDLQVEQLRRKVEDLGLQAQVRFLGPRPRSRLAPFLRSAHVLVVPSRSDPLPTVVLEAMLAGVPVIGSAVGGIPFLLDGGSCGALVPPEDSESLAQALADLARSPARRAALAAAALNRASTRFTWERCGADLDAALRGLPGIDPPDPPCP
ncbi:glycosyltransferase family 4 protein [Synechococcus sp. CS-1328]|nr:glycosyltransferase family 4 protein [Synechococcus sp. CS-1328]